MILYKNTTEGRPIWRKIARDLKKRFNVVGWYVYHSWEKAGSSKGLPKRWGDHRKVYTLYVGIHYQNCSLDKLNREYNLKYKNTNIRVVFDWWHESLYEYFKKKFPEVYLDYGYHYPLYDMNPKETIAVDPHTHIGDIRTIISCHYTPPYLVGLIRKKSKGLKKFWVFINYSYNTGRAGAVIRTGDWWGNKK